jgi:hypothetical protein
MFTYRSKSFLHTSPAPQPSLSYLFSSIPNNYKSRSRRPNIKIEHTIYSLAITRNNPGNAASGTTSRNPLSPATKTISGFTCDAR